MQTCKISAALVAGFMCAASVTTSAQEKSPQRYTMLDQSFSGFGSSAPVDNQDYISAGGQVFFALIDDSQSDKNLLCSGLKLTVDQGFNTNQVDMRTASRTLWALWRKVAQDTPETAEYGSCIQVDKFGELKSVNTEIILEGGMSFTEHFQIFKQDKIPLDNTWNYEQKLIDRSYPELRKQPSRESPAFEKFKKEMDQYRNKTFFKLDEFVSDCKNAGFFWDQAMDIWHGKFNGELPVCDRLYP